jgi:hypothetical protein
MLNHIYDDQRASGSTLFKGAIDLGWRWKPVLAFDYSIAAAGAWS